MRRFFDRCEIEIKAGYKTFYGHVMSQPEADQYNGYTELIEKAEASGQSETEYCSFSKCEQFKEPQPEYTEDVFCEACGKRISYGTFCVGCDPNSEWNRR